MTKKYPKARKGGVTKTKALLAPETRDVSNAGLDLKLKKEISSPEDVQAAAEKAPRVFSIGAFYRPIWTMRNKGYSWRYLADWLKKFGIEISYVHLRRLFAHEDARLSKLNEKQLLELGMPPDQIKERLESIDPAERLPAADPGDDEPEEETP